MARAFEHAIQNFGTMADRPYNVGLSDANLSKAELCERIRKHIPAFQYLEAPVGEDPDGLVAEARRAPVEAVGDLRLHHHDDLDNRREVRQQVQQYGKSLPTHQWLRTTSVLLQIQRHQLM